MECDLCRKYAKLYSDEVLCAFDNGTFSSDNYFCVSMLYLRTLCDDSSKTPHYFWNEDVCFGVIPYLSKVDEDGSFYYPVFIVLSWYKHRGATGTALWVCDDAPSRLIEEDDIKMLIAYHKGDVAIVLDLEEET